MYTLPQWVEAASEGVDAFVVRSQSVQEKLWSAGGIELAFCMTSCPFEESLIVEVTQVRKKPDIS